MEVVVPVKDFHFDSTSTTPYVSAPSSPKRFGGDALDYYYHYTSAPTSPTRAAAIYAHFTAAADVSISSPTASSPVAGYDDFAFDFSGQLEKGGPAPEPAAADELFEEGRIRPLKLPPRLRHPVPDDASSFASSPRSPKQKGLWSPRRRGGGGEGGEGVDPFTAAMMEVTRDRGRERLSSSTSRKGSRSLSPLRGGGGGGVGVFPKSPNSSPSRSATATSSAAAAATSSAAAAATSVKSGGSKKWRLRDLLLFRSASEGRATGNRSKDPLRKFTILPSSSSLLSPVANKQGARGEDSRSSSFRSTDSNGLVRRGSGAAVSAHEAHYMANRAASEELKKKTPLPYRQGLLGYLRFNPAVHSITRGFNNYSFNRPRS